MKTLSQWAVAALFFLAVNVFGQAPSYHGKFTGNGAAVTNVLRNVATISVDATNGNDSAGVRGQPQLPYQSIEAAIAASFPGDTINIAAGNYWPTTNLVLQPYQQLIGSGMGQTTIWWRSNSLSGPNSTNWVCIVINTNTHVAHLSCFSTNKALGAFAASIGTPPNVGQYLWYPSGLIEDCSIIGDTDGLYLPFGSTGLSVLGCVFYCSWDCVALFGSSVSPIIGQIDLYGCSLNETNQSVSSAVAPNETLFIQNGATVNMWGGRARISGAASSGNFLANVASGTLSYNNVDWVVSTAINNNIVVGGGRFIDNSGVGAGRIVSKTARPTTLTLGDTNLSTGSVNAADPNYGGVIHTSPVFDAGTLICETNIGSRLSIWNGLQWSPISSVNTNIVIVNITNDSVFSGTFNTYFFSHSGVDGAPGVSFTNLAGKHFLWAFGAPHDAEFGLSSQDTLNDANETYFLLGAGLGWPDLTVANSVGNLNTANASWQNLGTASPTIIFAAYQAIPGGSSFSMINTNFISGYWYTNSTIGLQRVEANAALTVAAVAGQACLSLWITKGQTNQSGMATTASSIAESYTNMISGYVPAGAGFTFTNTSTGAGNSATVLHGQLFEY